MSTGEPRATHWGELREGLELPSGRQHQLMVLPCFRFVYHAGEIEERPPDGCLVLSASGYVRSVPFDEAEDWGDGMLAFHFDGIRRGLSYTLVCQSSEGTTALMQDVSLDPFIDHMDDPDAPLPPLALATPPVRPITPESGPDQLLGEQSPPDTRLAGVHGLPPARGAVLA